MPDSRTRHHTEAPSAMPAVSTFDDLGVPPRLNSDAIGEVTGSHLVGFEDGRYAIVMQNNVYVGGPATIYNQVGRMACCDDCHCVLLAQQVIVKDMEAHGIDETAFMRMVETDEDMLEVHTVSQAGTPGDNGPPSEDPVEDNEANVVLGFSVSSIANMAAQHLVGNVMVAWRNFRHRIAVAFGTGMEQTVKGFLINVEADGDFFARFWSRRISRRSYRLA